MMNRKDNGRSMQTKRRLTRAFSEILQTKEYTEISVQEICTLAGVNRTTFYTHFKSIQDMMAYMEESIGTRLFDALYTGKEPDTVGGREDLLNYLYFVRDNAAEFQICFRNATAETFQNEIRHFLRETMRYYISRHHLAPTIDTELILNFYEAGLFAIIRNWVLTGTRETPEEIAEIVRLCTSCLRNPREEN